LETTCLPFKISTMDWRHGSNGRAPP
jgi:hypothetical protein